MTLSAVVVAGLAARAVGYLVAESAAFNGTRQKVEDAEVVAWTRFVNGRRFARFVWLPVAKTGELLQCPTCVGYWAALGFTWEGGPVPLDWFAASAVSLLAVQLPSMFRPKQTVVDITP